MRLNCLPCYIKQAMNEINMSNLDPERAECAMRSVLELLSREHYDRTPTDIAWMIHLTVQEQGGSPDPFLADKDSSTDSAKEMVPFLKARIETSKDPLYEAILISAAGNVIDYGAKNLFDLEETLTRSEQRGFAIDHYDRFLEREKACRDVYYIVDNSGEIVLDTLLIDQLLSRREDRKVIVVAKRAPVLNDVTVKDLKRTGLHTMDRVELIESTNEGWVGKEEVRKWLKDGLVISKGQGNFEGLEGLSGIFFLLIIKCEVIGDILNAELGDMIFKEG